LGPERIFARVPEPEALLRYPETAQLDALTIPVEYHFAPGESRDGASLRIPILALPGLTRAAVDAAVPGFSEPRIGRCCAHCPRTRAAT
jgi:ATP-dependent helicase HrpA